MAKLQRLQNRGLKVCKGNYDRIATDQLHTESGVKLLAERRKEQLLVIMYKRSKKLNLLPSANPRTRADLKVKFALRRPKLEKFKKSPLYRGVKLWSRLKPRVQTSDNVEIFKSKCMTNPEDTESDDSAPEGHPSDSEDE